MGLSRNSTRGRWLIVALIGGGAATALVFRSSGRAAYVPLPDAQAVVRSIDAVALRQKSVRWAEEDGILLTDGGGGFGPTGKNGRATRLHWRSTSDVTADSGVQRVTIPHFRGGLARAELRLVGNALYVQGNARALEWMTLKLTDAQALRYAGRWISIPKWRNPLREVQEEMTDVTVPEYLTLADLVAAEANPGGWGPHSQLTDWAYLTATRKSDGTQVVDYTEDGSELSPTIDLSARTGGEPLPLASTGDWEGYEASMWDSYWSSGRFSRWNEPVHVIAPKHAVPIATVRGR
jgi:hypothetical protein